VRKKGQNISVKQSCLDVHQDETGWTKFRASQYFISSNLPLANSWRDAQATCQNLMPLSNLAQIDDEVENAFLVSLLFSLVANENLQKWDVYFGNIVWQVADKQVFLRLDF